MDKSSREMRSVECPPLACEEIVDLYLKDVDRSLIRENLKLSYIERLRRAQANAQAAASLQGKAIPGATKHEEAQ